VTTECEELYIGYNLERESKMKLKYTVFLLAMGFVSHMSPSALYAADAESLKKLESTLSKKSNESSKSLDLSGVDMRSYDLCSSKGSAKIDFRNANLKGTNFSGMKICNVNFEGANLEKANFEKTHISSCSFRDIQAAGIKFTGASIRWTGFNHSKLEGGQFDRVTFESVGFDHANIKHSNFDGSTLFQVNFYYADLTGYSHEGARMDRTNFERSKGTSWFD